jgi:ABC-type glycerol-3-phosphate transport system substrate-binding protein
MILEFTIIKKCNYELSSGNRTFIPKVMVGLNNASKNPDTSKKFIEFLLSEEVQNANVYDGFPVNVNSLNKWMAEESQGTFGASTKDGTEIIGTWPTKEQREELLKIIQDLKTPIKIDQTIFKIIIEESLPYFTGDISVEQAAAAANTKINTYLAE